MDFLVFSDLHAHSFKFGSKWVIDEELGPINSRLLDSIKCIRQVYDYAHKEGIEHIFFAGDMFHVPEHPPTEVVSAVYKTIKNRAWMSKKLYMLPGNHDISSKSGLNHALVPFADVATVVSSYEHLIVGDLVRFHVVPYRESKSAYLAMAMEAAANAEKSLFNVLISHIGIQGATVGADYVLVSEQDVDLNEIPYQQFDLALFGHFHEHQKLAPHTYFIGATHQHNWGDAGCERGFLHCHFGLDGLTFSRVPLEAPKFHRIKAGAEADVKPGDFVMITGKGDMAAAKKAALLAYPLAAYVDVKPEKETVDASTVELPSSWSQTELLTSWVESKGPAKLAKKKLLNLGLELLGAANEED